MEDAIKSNLKETGWEGVHRIYIVQDMVITMFTRVLLVNIVMTHKMLEFSKLAEQLLVFQEGLYSMELVN
jgi:hypothetical protein